MEKNGTVTGIPASTSVFPSQYHSINAAYFIFIVNRNRDKRAKSESLTTKITLRELPENTKETK
jgi:hypothetical protein